jgi:hypothetical protein
MALSEVSKEQQSIECATAVSTLNRGARSRLDNGQHQLPIAIIALVLVLVLVLVWADANRTLVFDQHHRPPTTNIGSVECASNHCVKPDRKCVSLANTRGL